MDNTNNQNPANEVSTLNKEVVQMNVDEAQGTVRSKASWFFWISGLSFINIFLAAKGVFFIVGLAISQIIDGIVFEITGDINYFISLIAPILFAVFGYFAFKLKRWAFIAGSLVYILDGLIYLYFQEWLATGFHIFILYNLYKGYKEITEYERELAQLN
jgi:hypothetical protein